MKCELHVAAACDFELIDDIQGCTSEHLILFITECLRRCYDDTVSCMNTNRIDILHIADRDAVACTVTDNFIFDFLPTGNTALYQNLMCTGQTQPVGQNILQFCLIMRNTAAAAAKCIGRAQHNRIADFACEYGAAFYIVNHQ